MGTRPGGEKWKDPTPQQGQAVRLPIETDDTKTHIQPSSGSSPKDIYIPALPDLQSSYLANETTL